MQPHLIEQLLKNIDARATRIAQFLPAMITKQELRDAIESAASRLATKEELREGNEAIRDEVRLVAEQLHAIQQQLDERRT